MESTSWQWKVPIHLWGQQTGVLPSDPGSERFQWVQDLGKSLSKVGDFSSHFLKSVLFIMVLEYFVGSYTFDSVWYILFRVVWNGEQEGKSLKNIFCMSGHLFMYFHARCSKGKTVALHRFQPPSTWHTQRPNHTHTCTHGLAKTNKEDREATRWLKLYTQNSSKY